jgi:outer membrane lipoprotein SlyB
MGDKAYDIEKKYAELRENASSDQIEALRKMERLEKSINSGITSILSKVANSFTSIGGNMLTSAISTGISSGDFKDLSSMFSGKNKAMGYGALGSLAGGLIQGSTSKTSVLGQGLGGALAGAGTGAAIGSVVPVIGTAIGAVAGAVIGGLAGILGASKKRREEELMELQLAEQKKLVALQERQQALAYASSIIGQQVNGGIVTAVDRDSFGNLVAKINGKDIELVLERTKSGRG